MNAPSVDIRDMLVADSSIGLEYDTPSTRNLFIGREPDKPIDCVTIFDTAGYPPALGLADQGYEYPSIQIRVHNKDYIVGMDLAQEIKESLHGRSHEIWNDTLYTVIASTGGPTLLDWDENGFPHIVINFNLQRRAV